MFMQFKWCLLLLVLLLFPRMAGAATLLVYNNNDSGPGSLRQAIIDNNALGGGNTILFSNIVTGTITLTSGELLITKHGTISGPGPGVLAVDGNSNRVFHVMITNDAAVLISGLTITNGAPPPFSFTAGGGIWNDHSIVVIENCVITGNTGNTGAGIWNDGSVSRSASLVIRDCTFRGNVGGSGAGIWNNGESGVAAVSVSSSTFSGNKAVNVGAGIWNYGRDGNASLTVNACTFSSNAVTSTGQFDNGGAIYNQGTLGSATLFVMASTFNGNSANSGGAIFINNAPSGTARLNIGDTILRAGASGGTIGNDFGEITSSGYNLSSDGAAGYLTNVTDRINTDPLLGPLANNGGPTFTHALLPGSPAIDQGKRNAISHLFRSTDQRGRLRPFDFTLLANAAGGDGSDIGAFEVIPNAPVLRIARLVNDVVVSWSTNDTGFTLQTRTDLFSSDWLNVPGNPAIVGSEFAVTNSTTEGAVFYRLKQ